MHTDGAFLAISKNLSSIGKDDRTSARVPPSIISILPEIFFSNSFSFKLMSSTVVNSFISNICYLLDLRPAEIAMHLAVSILSPVSIHTYIPALRRVSIVVRTSSCNLSSTPVIPRYSMSPSIDSMASMISSSLLERLALARLYR